MRWVATDGQAGQHDIVSGTRASGQPDVIDGAFNSLGLLQAGEEGGFVHAFETGIFAYFCSPHQSMVATITVVDTPAPTPAPTDSTSTSSPTPAPTLCPTPSPTELCFNEPATSFCHAVRKYWGPDSTTTPEQ